MNTVETTPQYSQEDKKKKHYLMFKIIQYTFLFMLIMLLYNPAYAEIDNIPKAVLSVTVQIKTEEKVESDRLYFESLTEHKLEKGFHVLTLVCADDSRCWLTTVTLRCRPYDDKTEVFDPVVERSSTEEGNLKVRNGGNSLIAQETSSDIFGGEYVNRLRFDYEPVEKGQIISRVIGFSGGFVKNSRILDKVYASEYVPLPKAKQIMKLGCDPLLPGIDNR